MYLTKTSRRLIAAACALLISQSSFARGTLIDAESVEFATGNKTQMLRFGAQSDWNARWFAANGNHLSGYWDASVALWRGNQYQDKPGVTQSITDLGFTPVFRFQHDNKKGMYAEGGIGVHRLSELYDNDGRRLSTHFQFGDHLGIGYVFDEQWELGMKLQHFSNGGYRKPNSGVNFVEIKASYHF